jgi:ABC-type branched-subunit amino acid transport system permease subunit
MAGLVPAIVAAAGLPGFIIGRPSLRLKGHDRAIATLGM